MLLELLREEVLHANQEIARRGLAPHTFGNASGIDRSGAQPLVVIKPSGVDYARLTPSRPGRHRSGWADRRRHPAAIERSGHAHPALPRVSPDRRHRPHSLRVRDLLGPGLPLRFPASAPPMLTIFMGRFRSPNHSRPRKWPKLTCAIPVPLSSASSARRAGPGRRSRCVGCRSRAICMGKIARRSRGTRRRAGVHRPPGISHHPAESCGRRGSCVTLASTITCASTARKRRMASTDGELPRNRRGLEIASVESGAQSEGFHT